METETSIPTDEALLRTIKEVLSFHVSPLVEALVERGFEVNVFSTTALKYELKNGMALVQWKAIAKKELK